jgi:hypothetical protein
MHFAMMPLFCSSPVRSLFASLIRLTLDHAFGCIKRDVLSVQGSFLGRVNSSVMGDTAKVVSQLGTTRSYVFGKENSQMGPNSEAGPIEVQHALSLFTVG